MNLKNKPWLETASKAETYRTCSLPHSEQLHIFPDACGRPGDIFSRCQSSSEEEEGEEEGEEEAAPSPTSTSGTWERPPPSRHPPPGSQGSVMPCNPRITPTASSSGGSSAGRRSHPTRGWTHQPPSLLLFPVPCKRPASLPAAPFPALHAAGSGLIHLITTCSTPPLLGSVQTLRKVT